MLMSDHQTFFQAIQDRPDDDAPRLVFADWLEERGEVERAEFIRTQCQLARQADPPRALADRIEELLTVHQEEWTDLAFAQWLGHPKKTCHNPQGHDFCKLVAQGIRARCELDRLPAGDPRRAYRQRRLRLLGERIEEEHDYLEATCSTPLFDTVEFRRGFVEKAVVQDFAVILFAEALPDLGVLRELEIENDATADIGDQAIERLVSVLDRLRLRTLDSAAAIEELGTVRLLAAAPAARALERLAVWFDFGDDGEAAVAVLAASPHLAGLRTLEVEHSRTFTDAAAEAVLDSPHLKGLTRCVLRPNAEWRVGAAVLKRWRKRFGRAPDDWR
jgi:uncharacterized protein (TIGR02996 family)